MKAVILAAGNGARLHGVGSDTPKCLLDVGGISLIERQIDTLRSLAIRDIIVVVGCGAGLVRAACGPEITYVTNDRYAVTNSLFSLWLAREHLRDGFVVLNADVLFDRRMLARLLASRREDALLYEPVADRTSALGDEEMKVRINNRRVVEISKEIDPAVADGENVGIVKFGAAGADLVVEHMDRLVSEGADRAWAPRAFQEFTRDRSLFAIATSGDPWIEIDFTEDHQRAETEVLPRIERTDVRQADVLASAGVTKLR
jgi:choline kinase